jgi:UDP-3-O-acyl-N-acetylglucosamine deacetylase
LILRPFVSNIGTFPKWLPGDHHSGRVVESFKVSFDIDVDQPAMDEEQRHFEIDFSSTSFVKGVSRGRTFGFLRDSETLREDGLAPGRAWTRRSASVCSARA